MHPYIDMHCDSLLRVLTEGEASLYNGNGRQSFQKMAEAGQLCQFFAIFFRPAWRGKMIKETSMDEVYFERLRNALYAQAEAHADIIGMAHHYAEIQENRQLGKASALLTLEDGRLVDGCLEKLYEIYQKGVRAITLTWNNENCFGYPCSKDSKLMQKGLTAFGKEAVEEMNRLGMLIDVSHLSDGGFWDVACLSERPFIASHSNCRTLVKHPRNLSDDMIVCLAQKGGVAGLNLFPEFAGESLIAQVLHFVKVGGEDCVGIGADLDGFDEAVEIDAPIKMERLFHELGRCGLTSRQLDKLASGNVLRVIKASMG